MKRILFYSLFTILGSLCPALADEVTMEATQSSDGQWTLYVNMNNPSTIYSGFQMDFVIPDGITADLSNVAKTPRTTNLKLQGSVASNGLPRVVGYSSNKRSNITGSSGRIFSLPLSVDVSLPSGTYTLVAKNVRFTNTNGVETVLPNATCTITISANPQYILTFWDGDEIYYTTTMEAGATIHPILDPDPREGYSFCGWGDVPEVMPAQSLDLHAIWCVNSYVLRYKVDDEVVHTVMVAYGTALPDYTPDEVEGYSFCGWGADVPATMPAHDVELTAKYCVNSYELKFVVDGETVETRQLAYGSPIPTFNPPVIDGWVFIGWEGEELTTMPAHDVTYTARYVKKGDVNLDGNINTADVVAVYSYIISGVDSGVDRERADVNNDGNVNTADVTAIYYIITYGN